MTRSIQLDPDGQWRPAIPLPFYTWSWFGTKKRYHCSCKAAFKKEEGYRAHYREVHYDPTYR